MTDTRRPRQHARGNTMHFHSKHAATLDGHRPDDPHGITAATASAVTHEEVTARPVGWTGAIRRQPQTVPYDDEQDYGQRVEALDYLAERVDSEEQGWEPGELDHESDEYAKLGMEGQGGYADYNEQDMRDHKYKDNPDVLSGEYGKAGGEDPVGWQSPKDKAQWKAQRALKDSLDPFDDSAGAQAIKNMRTPMQTSKESWLGQRKKSQADWVTGRDDRVYPHLAADPFDDDDVWPGKK